MRDEIWEIHLALLLDTNQYFKKSIACLYTINKQLENKI